MTGRRCASEGCAGELVNILSRKFWGAHTDRKEHPIIVKEQDEGFECIAEKIAMESLIEISCYKRR